MFELLEKYDKILCISTKKDIKVGSLMEIFAFGKFLWSQWKKKFFYFFFLTEYFQISKWCDFFLWASPCIQLCLRDLSLGIEDILKENII